MKLLNTKQSVTVPEEVECSVKARVVTVKGARGTLVRSFRHLAVDIFMSDKNTVTVILPALLSLNYPTIRKYHLFQRHKLIVHPYTHINQHFIRITLIV